MLSIVVLAAETANNDSEGKRRILLIRNVHTVSLIKLRDVTLPTDILHDCHRSRDLPKVLQRFYTSLSLS